jgi:antitoxin VapB
MTLEIHAPKAETLAQALATATGEDIDTAVVRAIEERLARVPRRPTASRDADIDALFDRLARMPILDPRSPDEIIGYASGGLPN